MNKEQIIKNKLVYQEKKIREEMEKEERVATLEATYKNQLEEFRRELEDAKSKLWDAFDEIEKVSEKYGLPCSFRSDMINASYTPVNFKDIWGELDYDLLDCCPGEYGEGWQASAVC